MAGDNGQISGYRCAFKAAQAIGPTVESGIEGVIIKLMCGDSCPNVILGLEDARRLNAALTIVFERLDLGLYDDDENES